jgi:hypothetical protein
MHISLTKNRVWTVVEKAHKISDFVPVELDLIKVILNGNNGNISSLRGPQQTPEFAQILNENDIEMGNADLYLIKKLKEGGIT